MRYKLSILIFVGVLLVAVAIAGCTSSGNNGSTTTASPTVSGATPTPLPAVGSTLTVNSVLDLSNVHWYKYQIAPSGTVVDLGAGFTTAGATMTQRWDFNVNYNGQAADEISGTGNYPSNDGSGTTFEYLSHSDHSQVLGGNMTVSKNNKVVYQGALTPNMIMLQSILDLTNATYSGPHTVTYGGTQTVTVPSGTYPTTVYMYNGAFNLTIYNDPSVPVPIKVNAVSPEGTVYDIELMGWG
jgi:hypothetical protein